jgi:plasmid rolling circle replication initiator protein Rep
LFSISSYILQTTECTNIGNWTHILRQNIPVQIHVPAYKLRKDSMVSITFEAPKKLQEQKIFSMEDIDEMTHNVLLPAAV